MTTTAIRNRKAPKRNQKDEPKRYAKSILVENLRVGDEIVTMFRGNEDTMTRIVAKSHKVTDIDECAGQWRTHIHVNKKDCYDVRQRIWVVAK